MSLSDALEAIPPARRTSTQPLTAGAGRTPHAPRTLTLFGLHLTDTTLDQAAADVVRLAAAGTTAQISFLNADCVNIMHRNQAYREALANSDRIFADGIGVRLAARMFGHTLQDNVNGTDLFPVLCRHAAEEGVGIFLFGAREDRARRSGIAMAAANPGLVVSGSHHGYITSPDDEARIIGEINASGAGILLVALGAPAQELWIARNRHRLQTPVILGVGGLFDYYSGSIPRAPLAVRKARMEWVWRLAMEPRRLAHRYIVGNAEFLLRLSHMSLARRPS